MPAPIQFGAEPFTASADARPEGVPDHATMIGGRLIHLNVKNLKEWGVTAKATEQIIAGMPGIPIRACMGVDPHACDYSSDNSANVGWATRAWVEDGWIMAAAAITDREAIKKIDDKTWMPLNQGSWSVAGFPSAPTADFEISGLTDGFNPDAIALITGNGKPAFEGSGFEMVAAAITNHRGDDMETKYKTGGNDPVTYSQDDLDAKIADAVKAATDLQKTEFEGAKNKHTTEELAKQKIEYDAAIDKLSTDDKAAFDARIAEMTPTVDVEKMIAAAVTQGQADTLEAIDKDKLVTEYGGMLTASVVLGAPYMTDGVIDPAKLDAKMASVRGMKVAAISDIIGEAKMVAAAVPGKSRFDTNPVSGTPPGATKDDLLADLDAMDGATGQVR